MEIVPKTTSNSEEEEEALVNAYQKIEARRALVWEMMIQGVPQLRMAKELGVGRRTIVRDVNYLQSQAADSVSKLKTSKNHVAAEIGETLKRLDWVFQNAAMEYTASTVAASKNRFLTTAMKATIARTKILIDTGYLPKAGTNLKVEVEHTSSFAAMFGEVGAVLDDPVKRRQAMEIAAKLITVVPKKITTTKTE